VCVFAGWKEISALGLLHALCLLHALGLLHAHHALGFTMYVYVCMSWHTPQTATSGTVLVHCFCLE
jgi:hypothetical protein